MEPGMETDDDWLRSCRWISNQQLPLTVAAAFNAALLAPPPTHVRELWGACVGGLAEQESVLSIASCRNAGILKELLERLAQRKPADMASAERCAAALGLLASAIPSLARPAIKILAGGRPLLDRLTQPAEHQPSTVLALLVTAHTWLAIAPEEAHKLGDWTPLIGVLGESRFGEAVCSMAARCVAAVNHSSDAVRSQMLKAVGAELHQIESSSQSEAAALCYASLFAGAGCGESNGDADAVTSVEWVPVASAMRNLGALEAAIALKGGALIEGPAGGGKTATIDQSARRAGKHDTMVRVYADDQLDSKVLLGGYTCTEVPGEFQWQPGPLTTAMLHGHWCVIDNIEAAPMEVLQVLLPVLATRRVFLPAQGRTIEAADGFQLIATRCTGAKAVPTGLAAWIRVPVEPIVSEELADVVSSKTGLPLAVVLVLIDAYRELSGDAAPSMEPIPNNVLGMLSRRMCIRDLFKWAARVGPLRAVVDGNPALLRTGSTAAELVLKEAWDVLARWIADEGQRLLVASAVGRVFGVPNERTEQMLQREKPTLSAGAGKFRIGRSILPAAESEVAASGVYAETGVAVRLLEAMASSVAWNEPILLVGETGTGKTSAIQYLASQVGRKLVVQNLNQQSDASDFLGGYKPVDVSWLFAKHKRRFDALFRRCFSAKSNQDFLAKVDRTFEAGSWRDLLKLWKKAGKMAKSKMQPDAKRPMSAELRASWAMFWQVSEALAQQVDSTEGKRRFAFAFVHGPLVTALRDGDWILLDEINLASPETLQRIAGLLESDRLVLPECGAGEDSVIIRHPNFRLFAAMNPPSDIGKKDLPRPLRTRFTELYVDEVSNREDLNRVVQKQFATCLAAQQPPAEDIVNFFINARGLTHLVDGSGRRPTYGLRNLSRALQYVKMQTGQGCHMARALVDGFVMTFQSCLDQPSKPILEKEMHTTLLSKFASVVNSTQRLPPRPGLDFEPIAKHWVRKGPLPIKEQSKFVLTKSVEITLQAVARAVAFGKYPLLLQGPTSAGKTSIVEYMAAATGHRFVRINNHEHTDLEEYLGGYVSDPDSGRLVFREGALVTALREGHWVVLDELNLAPSDVLEALNRLLDDNRELFIAETQTLVRPHAHFMLFATQNPPGAYGGRKVLSRAFTNRFLEVNVDTIPPEELELMLHQRCHMPASRASKVVAVMCELQRRRQASAVFAGKDGYITPRDLFRWAGREPSSYQDLAEHGYFILAERLRKDLEKDVVKEVLERVIGERDAKGQAGGVACIDEAELYAMPDEAMSQAANAAGLAWTFGMRRLARLVGECITVREAVLLVGETGCGKTTVCQLFSQLRGQTLHIINCHQHTDASDFIGGLRPVRGKRKKFEAIRAKLSELRTVLGEDANENDQSDDELLNLLQQTLDVAEKATSAQPQLIEQLRELRSQASALFAWADGPLVTAMRNGDMLLIDEISLADDAVLERLNSVLDPSATLTLAEKSAEEVEEIVAHKNFRLLATMNPGGDFGKKELSPALRNRFTEIWVPAINNAADLERIVADRVSVPEFGVLVKPMVQFWEWYNSPANASLAGSTPLSVRDMVSWAQFLSTCDPELPPGLVLKHGAELALIDGIGIGTGLAPRAANAYRVQCHAVLEAVLKQCGLSADTTDTAVVTLALRGDKFGAHPFMLQCGHLPPKKPNFAMEAVTTRQNIDRVIRAMQLSKPILLEGSPGVGKTSLVVSLAAATGHNVVRINLSEQTDMMDLLGSDIPVAGRPGSFEWCDGVFLKALRAGDWVLLDELNLASQSVLEGLNSILDHRATIFIPEISEEVACPPTFRLFGCQNPLQQGCGRKGLPKSFLNRFTKVYVNELTRQDLTEIAATLHPDIPSSVMYKMISFNSAVACLGAAVGTESLAGAPWDFNLRDLFRWCDLVQSETQHSGEHWADQAAAHHYLVYLARLRRQKDRVRVCQLFKDAFGIDSLPQERFLSMSPTHVQLGSVFLERPAQQSGSRALNNQPLTLLPCLLGPLAALAKCVEMKWMGIVTGPEASGKTSIVRYLAHMTGHPLHEYCMDASVDVSELLGCFEQIDLSRHARIVISQIEALVMTSAETMLAQAPLSLATRDATVLMQSWDSFHSATADLGKALGTSSWLTEVQMAMADQTLDHCVPELATQVATVRERLQELDAKAKALSAGVGFEWVDGMLIRALTEGHWVLIDNVNYCNPSVLDRLNALLEPNGTMSVNECGLVDGELRVIEPHPQFRLFLAYNPEHGEVSRAMRNRGIEIFLAGVTSDSLDLRMLLAANGIPGMKLCCAMQQLHHRICQLNASASSEEKVSLHTAIQWSRLTVQAVTNGTPLIEALTESFERLYWHSSRSDTRRSNVKKAMDHWLSNDLVASNGEGTLAVPTIFPSMPGAERAGAVDARAFMLWQQVAPLYHQLCSGPKLSFTQLSSHLEGLGPLGALAILGNSAPQTLSLNKVQVAINYFTERATSADWKARIAWLHNIAQACGQSEAEPSQAYSAVMSGIGLLQSVMSDELIIRAVDTVRQHIAPEVVLSADELECEVRINVAMWRRLRCSSADFDALDGAVKRAALERHWILVQQLEQQMASAWTQKSQNQMSMIEQIAAIGGNGSKKIDAQLATHPVLVALMPLFAELSKHVSQWLTDLEAVPMLSEEQIDSIHDFIEARLNLSRWLSCQFQLSLPRLITYWRWLCKQLKRCGSHNLIVTPYLDLLVSKVNESMNYDPQARKNHLWKRYGCGALPATEAHSQMLNGLMAVDSQLLVSSTEDYAAAAPSDHPSLIATGAIRHDLLQGLATASYLCRTSPDSSDVSIEEQVAKHAELYEAMTLLPAALETKLQDEKKKTLQIQAHLEVNETDALLQRRRIWSLHDLESVKAELKVLTTAMSIVMFPENSAVSVSTYLKQVRAFVSHALERSSRAPSELLPYKSIEWLLDIPDHQKHVAWLPALLQQSLASWQSRLWSGSFNLVTCCRARAGKPSELLDGPAWLTNNAWLPFAPSGLLVSQDEQIGNKGERISELSGLLKFLCGEESATGVESATVAECEVELLWCLIMDVVQAYRSTFGIAEGASIAECIAQRAAVPLDKLASSSDALFASTCAQLIAEASHVLAEAPRDTSSRGRSWCLVGLARFLLLVPATVVDPCEKASIKVSLYEAQLEQVSEELIFRTEIEQQTGICDEFRIHELTQRQLSLTNALERHRAAARLRPVPPLFGALVEELNHISADILSCKRVNNILTLRNKPAMFAPAEASWQASCTQIVKRLNQSYTMYSDVINPLCSAAGCVRHGLRLVLFGLVQDRQQAPQVALRDSMVALVQFPSPVVPIGRMQNLLRAVQRVTASAEVLPLAAATPTMLAIVSRVELQAVRTGVLELPLIRLLDETCSVFVRCYKRARADERARQMEADSLYKYKETEYSLGDEEAKEEAAMKAMFPEYSHVFADLEHHDGDVGLESGAKAEEAEAPLAIEAELDAKHTFSVIRILRHLFGSMSTDSVLQLPDDCTTQRIKLLRLAHQAMALTVPVLGPTGLLDEESGSLMRSGEVAITAMLLQQLRGTQSFIEDTTSGGYDIYSDPNIEELRLAQVPVLAFAERISELLAEFEEQPILEQLLKIANRMLEQPLTSPIMKVVTGLELLLRKGYDWEQCAHKGVSVGPQLDVIQKLVGRWRRMELEGARQLLESRAHSHVVKASKFWFHLYALVHNTAVDDEEILTESLDEIFELLNDLMTGATAGDFVERLQLIQSTYQQLTAELNVSYSRPHEEAEPETDRRQALRHVLYHVQRYYGQFGEVVTSHVTYCRDPIEDRLKHFAKLARWDLEDYNFLVAASDKSHRTIMKCMRDFDLVLQEKVTAHLEPPLAKWREELPAAGMAVAKTGQKKRRLNAGALTGASAQDLPPLPSWVVAFKSSRDKLFCLPRLPTLLRKMPAKRAVIMKHGMAHAGGFSAGAGVRSLRNRIQQRTVCFNNEEASRMVKQTALGDVLKWLKESGFSPHASAQSSEQHNLRKLFESLAPNEATAGSAPESWLEADEKLYLCLARTLRLRQIGQHAAKDVQRLEVKKGLGFCEHAFNLMLVGHRTCGSVVHDLKVLQGNIEAFGQFTEDFGSGVALPRQEWLLKWLRLVKCNCDDLCEVLIESHMLIESVASTRVVYDDGTTMAAVERAIRDVKSVKMEIDTAIDRIGANSLLAPGMLQLVENSWKTLSEVVDLPSGVMPITAALHKTVQAVQLNHAKFQAELNSSFDGAEGDNQSVEDAAEDVVSRVLVAFQHLTELVEGADAAPVAEEIEESAASPSGAAAEGAEGEADDQEDFSQVRHSVKVDSAVTLMVNMVKKLGLEGLNQAITHFVSKLSHLSATVVGDWSGWLSVLCSIRCTLEQLEDIAKAVMLGSATLQVELVGLQYSLASLFQELFTKGYATKAEEAAEPQEGDTELQDGTGMGEGKGEEDVSEQIENQEQIEGLKDENREDIENDEKEEDKEKGVEMTDDFEGQMEDVPAPPEDEDKEGSEDEDEKEEVDRDMGDAGDESNIVDQKSWDSGEDNDIDEEKEKMDNKEMQGEDEEEPEMQAKQEEEEADKDKKDKDKKEDKPDDKPDDNAEEDKDQQNGEDEEGDDKDGEDKEEDKINEGEDDYEDQFAPDVREAEDFEMPEDEEAAEAEDEAMDGDEDKMDEAEDGMEDGSDRDENEAADEDMELPPEDQEAEEGKLPDNIPEDHEMDANEDAAAEGEDQDDGGSDDEDAEMEDDAAKEDLPYEGNENAGAEGEHHDTAPMPDNGADDQDAPATQAAAQQSSGAEQDNAQNAQATDKPQNAESEAQEGEGRPEANPMRSVGDASKHWKKQLDVTDQSSQKDQSKDEEVEQQQEAEDGQAQQYEFMKDDDEAPEDDQVLGQATEEQQQQDANVMVDEQDDGADDTKEEPAQQEADAEKEEKAPKEQQPQSTMQTAQTVLDKNAKEEEVTAAEAEDEEMEDPDGADGEGAAAEEPGINETFGEVADLVTDCCEEPEDKQDLDAIRAEIAQMMEKWRNSESGNLEEGGEMWDRYLAATSQLSNELCEALRLVLEPTLKTRLQSGYRTGKRIDMKKVVPYIASDFRKDRIWMRRSRPNNRCYQVMVAIDSSQSMMENGAGQLATEALVTISRALARLEVGQISLVSFGEEVEVLHPFDAPFSDATGAGWISKLTFEDERTDVLQLMKTTVPMLEEARHSTSGAAENVQILFVISDAVFSHRDACRAWVSEAAAKKQLIVFIIIDTNDGTSSVLERQSFSFGEDGSMLQISYMDTFPYPFYIVLRDINTMPQIVGDSLRQWFEMLQKM